MATKPPTACSWGTDIVGSDFGLRHQLQNPQRHRPHLGRHGPHRRDVDVGDVGDVGVATGIDDRAKSHHVGQNTWRLLAPSGARFQKSGEKKDFAGNTFSMTILKTFAEYMNVLVL